MSGSAPDRIMAAARAAFLESGFERASVDAIARAARVSKRSIYALYPTKAALFAAIMQQLARSAGAGEPTLAASDRLPEQVLKDHVRHYLASTVTVERRGLVRASIVAARQFPELYEELQRFRLDSVSVPLDQLRALLDARGQGAADMVELGRRIASLAVEGSRFLLLGQPDGQEQDFLAHASVRLLLDGYAACPPEAPATPETVPDVPAETGRSAGLRLPQERLDALLDAAAAEFLEHGYRNASLDRILAGLGISTATLHRHFSSKAGLYGRAVRHLAHRLWEAPCPAPDTADLEASLTGLARWILERHLHPQSLALQRLLIGEAEAFPEISRWAYARMLAAPVEQLQARLAVSGAASPSPFAQRAFFTLVTYGLRFVVTQETPEAEDRAALAADGVRLFLHGCGGAYASQADRMRK